MTNTTEDWFATAPQRRQTFLDRIMTGAYRTESMTHDASPRFYHRVFSGDKTYVLLESAPDGHPQALPGHDIAGFLAKGALLRTHGFQTPIPYEVDADHGFILMEDFGDLTFERAIDSKNTTEISDLYERATTLLIALRQLSPEDVSSLPHLEKARLYQVARRFADWFLPYYFNRPVRDDEIKAFLSMMQTVRGQCPDLPAGFIHGDFHPGNLMVLPDGSLGILDFSEAMAGPPVYDLTNLLQDARRNVAPEIITHCRSLYFEGEGANALEKWYSYYALHFHARVIGQFIRIALLSGKTTYLVHLERLKTYLAQNSSVDFQAYAKAAGIDFSRPLPPLDLEQVRSFIRDDAA